MKNFIFLFQYLLLSIATQAQYDQSQINRIRTGEYQISYPGQVIGVYFDFRPANGLQHITSSTEMDESEQYALAQILKDQIDQYPINFISEYLDLDIIPMNIHNDGEFGYNLDHQIIVEVEKIKQGMSYRNSVKSALAHQIAYLVDENPNFKSTTDELKSDLRSLHQTNDEFYRNTGYSIYEQGYVSRYASGEISGNYSASIEFAELFAHLTCDENRQDLMDFAHDNPDHVLSSKVRRFEKFLSNHIYHLNTNEISLSREPSYTTPEYNDMDGAGLLNIHELRSYESMGFDEMENEDNTFLSSADNDIYEELPTKSWDEPEPYVKQRVFKYNDAPGKNEEETQYQQNQQKRKKKKGTGLLITGAALYVLLQLLK